ncbi:MAG: hypothetical protein CMD77_04135 [Gammaproteobacteria bacterium]|nr:hypothetical protein [Gammaproteobacteria bacterium]
MPVSLFDGTVARFEQTLSATLGVLEKGRTHCKENGVNLDDIVETSLHPDMRPFRFQVISTVHHSAGALVGVKKGEFSPPQTADQNYEVLQGMVEGALKEIQGIDRGELEARGGADLTFRMGKNSIPFTVEDFLLSFSIPNFYFHATTTYDILRSQGVPVGKMDFLGNLQVKR